MLVPEIVHEKDVLVVLNHFMAGGQLTSVTNGHRMVTGT